MVEMTFKSSLLDRLRGKRNVVIKHEIDSVAKSGFPSIESLKSMVEKKVKKQ